MEGNPPKFFPWRKRVYTRREAVDLLDTNYKQKSQPI